MRRLIFVLNAGPKTAIVSPTVGGLSSLDKLGIRAPILALQKKENG